MNVRKTPIAVRELNTTYYRLIELIRGNKITPPGKDTSGDYLWSDEDLERARQALEAKQRRKVVSA